MDDTETLVQRVERYSFDEAPCAEGFAQRLARENRWSSAYTAGVVREYRRFVVLSRVSGHAVTPSDAVDQVWHLHLTYSERYWGSFCEQTLGRPLHHRPTRGGAGERVRYREDYEQTLESYERVFGEPPPPDIWPPSARRFGSDLNFARVNRDDNWIVPKPFDRLGGGGVVLVAVAVLGGSVLLGLPGPAFLRVYLVGWGVGLIAAHCVRRAQEAGVPATARAMDPYEVAQLGGGNAVTFRSAVATLVERKALTVDSETGVLTRGPGPFDARHEVEREVLFRTQPPERLTVRALEAESSALTALLRRDLEVQGLWLDRPAWSPFLIAMAFPALAAVRVVMGVVRDRPVAFVVLLCVFGTCAACWGFLPGSRLTRAGKRRLEQLRKEHDRLRGRPLSALAAEGLVPLQAGLFGLLWLQHSSREPAQKWLERANAGSHTGGGCGGDGGCGGGCGGCGGCGE